MPNEIDDIRRDMGQIRMKLYQEIRSVVVSAEAATDWRRYVRTYPFASLALAVGVGFLIVPRRRRSIRATAEAAATATAEKLHQEFVDSAPPRPRKAGWAGMIFGPAASLVGSMALKAAQNYASYYLENMIAQQMANRSQSTFEARPSTTRPR